MKEYLPRVSSLWWSGVVALMATACGSDDEPVCPSGAIEQALYFGNSEPSVVTLDAAERLAIVALTDAPDLTGNLCTGTLISERWIITARHCRSARPLAALFGSQAAEPLLVLDTARAIEHPELDLMLLELARPSVVSALALRPIPQMGEQVDQNLVGERAELAGFGQTETLGLGELRFVDEPITLVDETSLRVDGEGDSGGCFGDSGGPLLVSNGGRTAIAGVLSKGSASCLNQDLYIRLDVARDWIAAQMDRETTAEPCSGLARNGECTGQTAIWCEGGRLEASFCSDDGCSTTDAPQCSLCR